MASLTDVAITSRRTIRYGIYIIVLLIIARYTYKTGVSIYNKLNPPKPTPPNYSLGKLTTIPFPDKPKLENITYKLETPEGSLPKLIEQMPVYKIPPIESAFNTLDTAKEKAQNLGFNPDGKKIVENVPNVYLYESRSSPATLTMNIITGVFSISYDINADIGILDKFPPSPENAVQRARGFIGGAGLLSKDLEEGKSTFQYLKIEGGKFVPAIAQSEADFIKVNLFRKNPIFRETEFSTVTANMPEGNIWFLIGGSGNSGDSIIAGEYNYFGIDETSSGTYLIKSAQTAWDELNQGKAYISNLGNNSSQVTIRRVYVAYYDPGQYSEFYEPVIVFEGDNDFYAYVPAITDEYYGAKEN